MPLGDGVQLRPLRFLPQNRGRVLLLRLQPGTVVPLHRHTGEVHGFNLEGQRKLLDTGEVVGPGGYVYEPAGNQDTWMAFGDSPLTVFLTVRGAVEMLDAAGNVTDRDDTESIATSYRRFCIDAGLPIPERVFA
jgi:quercetin dioxygenase-like cupin family protein